MLDGPDEDGEGILSEKSPNEPEEFDPSSLGPDIPEAPDPPDGDASSDVAALFWTLVVVFNIALLALSVGPMIAYFQGDVQLGLQITLVGAIVFAYGTVRYVLFRRQRDDDSESGDTADDSETTTDTADHNG